MLQITWTTVACADLEASLHFYRDILGMRVVREIAPFEGTRIVFLACDGSTGVELLHRSGDGGPEKPGSGRLLSVGFATDAFDGIREKLRAEGAALPEPTVLPGGLECLMLTDPDGIGIQLIRASTLHGA